MAIIAWAVYLKIEDSKVKGVIFRLATNLSFLAVIFQNGSKLKACDLQIIFLECR